MAGTDRHAKAELMLANGVARLNHHGDIGARDQQDQCHKSH